jgi:hypothetical protein
MFALKMISQYLVLISFSWQMMSSIAFSQELVLEAAEADKIALLSGLELTNDQFTKLSKGIQSVADTITDEYLVSDSLSLTFYVLKYFAEIGEYEIEGDEIIRLAKGFLKLSKKSLPYEIWHIIKQMNKLKFGKKKGQDYVQIFSKNKFGIIYKINEYLAAEDGEKGTLLKHVLITNGAEFYFKYIKTSKQSLALSQYVRDQANPLALPTNWFKQLNRINHSFKKNILFYLNLDSNIFPLAIKMRGVSFEIITNSIFKKLNFEIKEAYALPGMTDGERSLPSTIFQGNAKLINLKLTIDQ